MNAEQQARIDELLAEPRLARLLSILDADGEETRIVGGAVRNALLGRPTDDVDIATTALPETVIQRARKSGLTPIPTGIAHGTVTVISDGRPFEVTTLRSDIETDGRHAKVAFGRDFDADARRRDFTVNSMSVSSDGRLHDPQDGQTDLAAGRIRFIGDAHQRIAEDYLRILRLFRFHAAYGEGPADPTALSAAIEGRHGLARLSAERLRAEIMKLLAARRGVESVTTMAECGLLGLVTAGVAYTGRLARISEIEAALGLFADPVLRLCALAVEVEEDVQRLRERLRLSNAETNRMRETAIILAQRHGQRFAPDSQALGELLFDHDRAAARDALMILHADSGSSADDPAWTQAHRSAAILPKPRLPVSGGDLVARGIPAGQRVGAALKALQANWIRAGFPQDPATLARLVEDVLPSGEQEA